MKKYNMIYFNQKIHNLDFFTKNENFLKKFLYKKMSVNNKQIKNDPVTEFLKAHVENNEKSDIAKYLLYANPNGSGIQTTKEGGYLKLKSKIAAMNSMPVESRVFDYSGMELPTKSVGMTVRVRFVIGELVSALEILNLARAHIYVNSANGVEWPSKSVSSLLGALKINLTFIKSMKSVIKGYLVDKLPTLIDDCYSAMYKSAGNFSYSLAETKLHVVYPQIIQAMLNWVGASVVPENFSSMSDDDVMFSVAYDKTVGGYVHSDTRRGLMDSVWVTTTPIKSKIGDNYHFPSHYVKLCKVLCARLGKVMKTSTTANDYESPEIAAVGVQFLTHFNMLSNPIISNPGTKKKEFQNAIFQELMKLILVTQNNAVSEVNSLYVQHPGLETRLASKDYVRSKIIELINSLVPWSDDKFLKFQSSLVYADTFANSLQQVTTSDGLTLNTFKPHFTKGDFNTALSKFQSGVCNARVTDAIYRFISVKSLSEVDHSRKTLDESIELALISKANLAKFTPTAAVDTQIIFSDKAMAAMSETERARWVVAKDPTGRTGLNQSGVMSMTSAIRDKSITVDQDLASNKDMLVYANTLDEIANCYARVFADEFNLKKNEKIKAKAREKIFARHTGNVAPQQYFSPGVNVPQQFVSPVAQTSPVVAAPVAQTSPVVTAPVAQTSPVVAAPSLFGAPSTSPTASTSPTVTSAPSLFGAPSTSPTSPTVTSAPGLFGAGTTSPTATTPAPGLFGAGTTSPTATTSPSNLFGTSA